MNGQDLIDLGLERAGQDLKRKQNLKRSLAIAYEHFKFVTPGIIDKFKIALKEKTIKREECSDCKGTGKSDKKDKSLLFSPPKGQCQKCWGEGYEKETFDTLSFISLKDYGEIPPPDCLLDLKKAKDMQIFDGFEVAKVETVEVRPDPIIFGVINGCVDKFFITQWDDDVSIEEILGE